MIRPAWTKPRNCWAQDGSRAASACGAALPSPRMDSHQQPLRRGFNWLGGAMIIAKLTDFGTILVVLLFLTKEQVGVASMVVAIGTVIEALDGLGTGAALVQAPSLSRLQLDSLFWVIA